MACHILLVGSEFTEILESQPVSLYAVSEKKPSVHTVLKKMKSLPGNPEKMGQNDTPEHPDYAPLGLKSKTPFIQCIRISSDIKIPFKEANRPQFHPEGHYLPPEVFHS